MIFVGFLFSCIHHHNAPCLPQKFSVTIVFSWVVWDHALSLLSLYVSLFFPLEPKKQKKNKDCLLRRLYYAREIGNNGYPKFGGGGRVNNVHYGLCKNGEFSHIPFVVCGWAFSLTWPASMQIYWNKWKYLHKKKVHVPQDCLWTLTWPPFHCFGTPIWPLWRHVKTPYRVLYRALGIFPNSARSHWLLRGYITSNNETVSRQNLWASNIEKSTATCKRTQHSRAKSLTDFKLCATTPNKAQQNDDRVCKRTQHVTSNNVASICTGVTVHCYPQMLTDDCRYSEV